MLLFAFFLSSNQFLVNEFENGGSTSNMKLDLIQSIFVVSSEQLVSAKYLLIDLFFFFFFLKIGGSYSAGQRVVSLPRA